MPLMPFHRHNLVLGSWDPFGLFPVSLSMAARTAHMYVIGITGKGKSKFLEHGLFQDIIGGRGCGLLDPHSDLADDLLRYLACHPQQASSHWDRIVYFDPSRTDFLIPFNVLSSHLTPYETAVNIVEAMRRTWPKTLEEAPRFANIALVSLLTLAMNKLTLLELPRLLTNATFRARLCERLDDPELLEFWQERYPRWGREQPLMIESLLNKVTAFTLNPHLRLILGAQDNQLSFRQIMDEGKVLIVDLGRVDGETRRLLGSLIVTGIEQAAISRKDRPAARTPFYFAIDEFQDFSATDGSSQTLAQILSECRKFGLHLTLAHQVLSQLGARMRGALGNIQTKVVFGVDREDAEVMATRLYGVDGQEVKHKVKNENQQERTHPVFYTLGEQWEKAIQFIQGLPDRCALVKAPGRGVVRMRTITVADRRCSEEKLAAIKRALAQQSGRPRHDIMAEIQRRRAAEHSVEPRRSEVILREKALRVVRACS